MFFSSSDKMNHQLFSFVSPLSEIHLTHSYCHWNCIFVLYTSMALAHAKPFDFENPIFLAFG